MKEFDTKHNITDAAGRVGVPDRCVLMGVLGGLENHSYGAADQSR